VSTLTGLDERQLTDAFERGCVPEGDFTHVDHVRVAWELLRRYPLGVALDQVSRGIRQLAEQRGAEGQYHETITTFYLLAVADRMTAGAEGAGFEEFAAANPELVGPSCVFLTGYYSAETLDGERTRRSFVLPERLP
jgi:hypothetical protein